MNILRVELNNDRGYPIYIGEDILSKPDFLIQHIHSKQVVIVTNVTVGPLYLNKILPLLCDFHVYQVVLPDGEQFKTLVYLEKIFEHLLENKISRNATLIALGGGVIGDMAGFAAACYQRGIAFIQIPTTLLAQVDSSVGGKTGVNHPLGKNMIGAFYQPQCVIADTTTLDTLDKRQFSAGLAEVIKYGLIRDPAFFDWLERHMSALLARDKSTLNYAIERSCTIKAEIVAEDEFESGVRATLNLGHTFGHAIETGTGYARYLHGEAVSIGTCFAADLSWRTGRISQNDMTRTIRLLKAAELPVIPPADLPAERYIELMAVYKKNVNGQTRVIVLEAIGKASLPITVESALLLQTLHQYAG
jgi:3-dehydroquinate synthase